MKYPSPRRRQFPWDAATPLIIALLVFALACAWGAQHRSTNPNPCPYYMAARPRRSKAWARERERIGLLRDMLIEALGNVCANWQRGCETPGEDLEIDHVDGCAWVQRDVSWATRIRRYVREYRAGVRLRILCRRCNGSRNQHTHGTRGARRDPYPHLAEAPF